MEAPGCEAASEPPSAPRRASLDAVARDRWSLRVTLDGALQDELETLKMLLSHKVRDGDLTEVLREAVRCAIEKHGRRRGAVAPARARGVNAGRSEQGERKAALAAEATPAAHEDEPASQPHPEACRAADEGSHAEQRAVPDRWR